MYKSNFWRNNYNEFFFIVKILIPTNVISLNIHFDFDNYKDCVLY